jgi:predicted O-linked N-acetylglucosamine transferase (SPINDLY family)
LGRREEAVAAYDQALRLRPAYALAHLNRGAALERLGRPEEALAAYDEALRVAPDFAQAHVNRGAALGRQCRFEEAIADYDRASAIDPKLAEAHVNRGAALARLGRVADALASLDRGLRLRPDDAVAHLNRGNLFMVQARFDLALLAYRQAMSLKPDYPEARSNYLFCMNYDPAQDDAALFDAHREWGERFGRSPDAFAFHSNVRDPDKVLRVGLVSADFGRHPIGFFLDGVLPAADRSRVHYVCYSGRLQEDELTGRLRRHAAGWRSSIGLSDRALAETVRADGIDILVDLAGHTGGGRLGCFALRPAPVLVHWAGSPHTIPAVDYSLWDWAHVPEGDERWFVETVVRLPHARVCYTAPPYTPEVADPPLLANGHITFGSFNNLAKLNPGVVGLWTRVLETVPGSRLMLNWPTLADPRERQRIADLFAAHGIEPGRLELTPGEDTHAGVLGQYGQLDIALDPFPFSGCTTTLEALWMGVPVVTLPGTRPVSRQSQAFLTALGRTEWIARDVEDYVRIVADLAADPQRLTALRREQRALVAASPVGDARRFAQDLEAALRSIWHRWCDPNRRTDGAASRPGN